MRADPSSAGGDAWEISGSRSGDTVMQMRAAPNRSRLRENVIRLARGVSVEHSRAVVSTK